MNPTDWREIRLGDLIQEHREKTTTQDQHVVLTSSRSGLVPQSEYYSGGRIDKRDNVGFHVIPKGYITYRSRSDDGQFFFNKNDYCSSGIISHFYPVFKLKDDDEDFFLDFLNFHRSAIGTRSVGSSQKVLSLNALKKMRFHLPAPEERARIAEILSTWDRAIETVEALIANARAQKNALVQSLLTGKKRLPGFTGNWEATALGERGSFRKGKGIARSEVRETGFPAIRYGEIYTHHHDLVRAFNSYVDAASARLSEKIKYGDILFTCSGETAEEIGKCVAFVDRHDAYAGGDIVIFTPAQDCPVFLAYLLNSPPIALQKAQMGQGNSVVHISSANLSKLRFTIPRRTEQEAIATVIIDADQEIFALQAENSALRQEKSALMQQLLTGKRRVKVDQREAA